MHPTRFLTAFLTTLACSLGAVPGVHAQPAGSSYPSRPIKLIVPFGPGGVTDIVARVVADGASKTLGQPIVVENKPGVNGTLAPSQLVGMQPDGYTLCVAALGIFRMPYLQPMRFEPVRDFTFVSMLAGYSYAIAVRSDSPWKTFEELVAHSRRDPDSISYGTSATYSSQHLAMIELGRMLNIQWTHLPFKGDAEATQNLLGNHVQATVASNTVLPYVRSGQIRLLASLEEQKGVGPFADVPPLKSMGFDISATAPYGIIGPKNMPADVVAKLDAAIRKAIASPNFQEAARRYGVVSQYRNHEQYTEYAQQTWAKEKLVMRTVLQSEGKKPVLP